MRTNDPTPAPIRAFTDLLLSMQLGRKKNQILRLLKSDLIFIQRRRIIFLNPRK